MERELCEKLCFPIWDIISSPELRALSPSTSHPTALQYSTCVLCIVTCIFGLPANIVVIFATGFLMKKNKYKIWFLNLALADFIFLLFLPLYVVYVLRQQSQYGSAVYIFYHFLTFINIYAGIYILTALNIDRALSVAKPVWHLKFRSRRFCWCMCAAIWVSSILLSIPAIIYSGVHGGCLCSFSYYDPTRFSNICGFTSKKNQTLTLFSQEMCRNFSDTNIVTEWKELTDKAWHLVLRLALFSYGIPLCVILISNIIIALHVKNSKMAASSRLYRVVIVAVMSFFCTRTPYVLSFMTLSVSASTMKIPLMYKVSIALPLFFSISATNCLLNPMVYVLVGKQIRGEIVNFFRKQ